MQIWINEDNVDGLRLIVYEWSSRNATSRFHLNWNLQNFLYGSSYHFF